MLFSSCSKNSTNNSKTVLPAQETEDIQCVDFLYPIGYANETGLYFTEYGSNGNSNIKFIDFLSKKCVSLCSRPECLHQDETCTSWLKYCENTFSTVPVNDKLLLIYNGSFLSTSYHAYGDDALTNIYVGNLNGTSMNKVATFKPQQTLSGKYAVSLDNLYVVTSETVENENDVQHYSFIAKVDLENGKMTESEKFDFPNLQIESAFKNNLILSYSQLSKNDSLNEFKSNILLYNTATGKNSYLLTIDPTEVSYKFTNNFLYTINHQSGELKALDLQSNTEEIICNVYQDNSAKEVFIKGIVTEGIIFDKRTKGMPDKSCFFDFSSNKVLDINLPLQANESLDPNRNIEIIAEYGNKYVVIVGLLMDSVTFSNTTGENYTLPIARYEFALIEKDNYINSIGKYEPIFCS